MYGTEFLFISFVTETYFDAFKSVIWVILTENLFRPLQ